VDLRVTSHTRSSAGARSSAPGTRFTIGTKFMNVDLARMLDEEYSRLQKR